MCVLRTVDACLRRAHARACVFNVQYLKDRTEKIMKEANGFMRDRYYYRRRIAILRSQDCTRSLLSGCARGSVTHGLIPSAHRDTQIDTDTHTYRHAHIQTQRTKAIHQHAQIRLSSRLWILFLMLLVSMLPNCCSGGACASAHLQPRSKPNPVGVLLLHLSQFLELSPTVSLTPPPPQRSRRDPDVRSKTPLAHAWKRPREAIVPAV